MGLILNSNAPSKMLYNGAEVSLYFNGSKIWPINVDPYNPLGLPPNTVRVRTSDGNVPIKSNEPGFETSYETATLVAGTTDVYDVYKSGSDFTNFLRLSTNVIEVLGANTTGITSMKGMFHSCSALPSVPLFDTSSATNMYYMFYECKSLSSVPLFNTSNVTDMTYMFSRCKFTTIPLFDTSNLTSMYYTFNTCTSLTSIPLFDTSKVTNMNYAFQNCYNVQSGALALYQQASTQTTPPTRHTSTFRNCGKNTTQGAAELAQIPSGWK